MTTKAELKALFRIRLKNKHINLMLNDIFL